MTMPPLPRPKGKIPPLEPHCKSYCGFLGWTVERYGRITHKHSCPVRTDNFCQSHPTECLDAGSENPEALEAERDSLAQQVIQLKEALQPFIRYYEREGFVYGFRDSDLEFLSRVIQFGWDRALEMGGPQHEHHFDIEHPSTMGLAGEPHGEIDWECSCGLLLSVWKAQQ